MKAFGIAAAIVLSALIAGSYVVASQGPTTAQLEADISEIDAQISEAAAAANQYNPGSPLHTQAVLRSEVLKTTRAVLDQKRRSFIRGITLSYTIDGKNLPEPSPDQIAKIGNEIEAAVADAKKAEESAAGTGGLVQIMALMQAQTHRAREAFGRLQLAMMKVGFVPPPLPEIGQTVDEKGAL